MAAAIQWITTIISAIIILIAAHISITIILPKLKDFLSPVIKEDKALSGLMTLLIILIAVLVFKSVIEQLLTLQNATLSLISVFSPGLDLIIGLSRYIGYIVLGFIVVLGIKSYK